MSIRKCVPIINLVFVLKAMSNTQMQSGALVYIPSLATTATGQDGILVHGCCDHGLIAFINQLGLVMFL